MVTDGPKLGLNPGAAKRYASKDKSEQHGLTITSVQGDGLFWPPRSSGIGRRCRSNLGSQLRTLHQRQAHRGQTECKLDERTVWVCLAVGDVLFPLTCHRLLTSYSVIHRADYLRLLADEVRRLGVEMRLDCQVTKIHCSAPYAELANGGRVQADVIIGADGKTAVFASSKVTKWTSRSSLDR